MGDTAISMRATKMMSARCSLFVALVLLAAASREVAADAPVDGEVLSAVRASMDIAGEDNSRESFLTVASCLGAKESARCLEQRSGRYRDQLIREQQSWETSRALNPADDSEAIRHAEELLDTMLPAEEDKDTNSRGHKLKKKIHKIIKIIKIIILIVVVKLKMVFVMLMMQTLFQFKMVAITFLILLIKKYYLWVEWKHKKEEKKAVVYYEHAQHQHHYDETDHFHDGLGGLLGHGAGHQQDYHKDPAAGAEGAGGWGGWWGKRSAEYPTAAAAVNVANNNNPALAAQQMAYSGHLQGNTPLIG